MSLATVLMAAALGSAAETHQRSAGRPPVGGHIARITVLVPKAGQREAFEDGYKRHLEWHRAQRDPWTWLGWTVVSGEHIGWFVDATFDRTPDEIATPVAPADDAADNAENVLPHISAVSSAFYLRHGPGLAARMLAAPFLSLTTCRVRPGRERDLQGALEASPGDQLALELVSGGERPTWLILRPASSLARMLDADRLPETDAIESCRTEALRQRPDLSYLPEAR